MADRGRISSILGALAVALALFVTGCGGGSDSTSASISKAAFVKKASAVCAEAGEQISSGVQSLTARYQGNEPKGAKLVAAQEELVKETVAPSKQKEAEEIRAIGAPEGDDAQVAAIADTLEEGVEEAEEQPQKIIHAEAVLFAKAAELANDYGLEGC